MGDTLNPSHWSLHDLLPEPDGKEMQGYLTQLEESVSFLESARPRLSPDLPISEFLEVLGHYEAIAKVASRLGAYAYLWFAEDTQNPAALNLRDRLDQILTEADNRTLFISLWLKELPEEPAQRLISASGDLHYHLESLRRFKPFTLSEAEEKIINLKDVNGIDALVNLYEMITNKFTFSLVVDGVEKILTRDQLSSYYHHPSAQVREATFRELYRVYGENALLLAQIYFHRARDWHAEGLELRGYQEPISARNLANDIPDPVVDTLLEVCRKNTGLFQRYFKLKARLLKMDRLRRYDIYAPLAQSEKRYDYSQAVEMVLGSFADFSPDLESLARRIFDENHLDSEARPGKRGGAFCYATLPWLTPWVLVNYSGQARDVATLAHELGHAVHSLLAAGHSVLTFHSALPLAETASVFAEMLLTDRLLKEEHDPVVRRDLLVHAIDEAYATVERQAYFTLFERQAHQLIVEGKTAEEISAIYMENLVEQFGQTVEVSDEFKWEWISIPHFYNSPFYTYAYSFGQLLVMALYQQYRLEGEAFIPRYVKILSYGGSKAPAEILKEAGLEISTAAFWQGGFDMLEGMIEELEKLAGGQA